MKKYLDYQKKFQQSYKLIDLLQFISFYSWEELEGYAKFSSSKVGEVRITEVLVSQIIYALCQQRVQVPIRLFHAKDEKANGNDLEIVIPVGKNENIILPCQAKRLYVETVKDNLKAKYKKISHLLDEGKSTQREQICSLLDYAKHKDVQGFPLYLFYNYTEFNPEKAEEYPLKELFGCTLVNANVVYDKFYSKESKKITLFTFQDIHPPAKPLTTLLDLKKISQLKTLFGESTQDFNVKIYSNDDLLKQSWWEEQCPPMSVDPDRKGATITLEELFSQPKTYEETPFNPKYRIMVLNEPEFFRYTKNIEL
jgi:hypothetical protein